MNALCVLAAYLVFSFITWGLTLGAFTRDFPYQRNLASAFWMAMFGPAGVLVALVCGRPYRWRVRPFSAEERWQAYQKLRPYADREQFERFFP